VVIVAVFVIPEAVAVMDISPGVPPRRAVTVNCTAVEPALIETLFGILILLAVVEYPMETATEELAGADCVTVQVEEPGSVIVVGLQVKEDSVAVREIWTVPPVADTGVPSPADEAAVASKT
jgi:hypothetical protein